MYKCSHTFWVANEENNVIASVTIDFDKQLQEYGMEPQKISLLNTCSVFGPQIDWLSVTNRGPRSAQSN